MNGNKIENPKAVVVMTEYSIIASQRQVTQLLLKFDVINGFEDSYSAWPSAGGNPRPCNIRGETLAEGRTKEVNNG